MVARQRLLDRLRERWFVPVTVLTAPAGHGKTTLLAQAVDANTTAPLGIDLWLSCQAISSTATVLGKGICEAVGAAPPADSRDLDAVAGAVAEAMWRRSPQQVALVIDDVHKIDIDSPAATLLSSVVAALPANGHLVLAGRQLPPTPLARLEVEGKVARLGAADLVFTDDELAEFAALRGVCRSKLATCGGWPAVAELSAIAGSDATGAYLAQEVLAVLAPIQRRQLALLTHIGPFDDELARAALDATVDLDELVAGLPLVTEVADGVHRLHPLWRSLLADEATPAEVAQARRRAALVLLRRGDASAAIPHLIGASAWGDLQEAIVTAFGAVHPQVPHDAPAEWYAQLPAHVRAEPSGRMLAAAVVAETEPELAEKELEECAAAFRDQGCAAGQVACLVQLARLAWWTEDPKRLGALSARVLQLEAEGAEEAAALACIGRAQLCDLENDIPGMLAELDRVPPGSLSEAWEGVVVWLRSLALLLLGDAAAALQTADRALSHPGDLHIPLAAGVRVQALCHLGRTDEAIRELPGVRRRLSDAGFRYHAAIADAQLSVLHSLGGEAHRAAECLAMARAAGVLPDAPLVATNLAVAEAAVAIASGDEPSAAAVLACSLASHPLWQGLSSHAQRQNLAVLYVLAPETRPHWDGADLGPAFLVARDLARAVAGVRCDRNLPSATPPLPPAAVVRAHLPLRWIADLGVAAVAAGRDDGWQLLEETWPATRPAVAGIAEDRCDPLRRTAAAVLGRLPVPPTGKLELRLLGPIELRRGGAPVDVPDWRRERVRSLLVYLVMNRTVSRERLTDVLWPDLDPVAASRNLRVTLTYLLRVLEPDRGARDPSFFLRQHGGNISLHPGDWLTVDIWGFDALCEQAEDADRRGAPAEALDRGLAAADLWHSEPTELLAQSWAVGEIEQRRRRFATTATRAGELLLARGNVEGARALAERALRLDPWLEAAHRLVVAGHRASGDDVEARRALVAYEDAIRDLGFTPDEATLMVKRLLDSVPAPADR